MKCARDRGWSGQPRRLGVMVIDDLSRIEAARAGRDSDGA
jgi:hypothetical protein